MTDVLTPAQRRRNMSAIRGKNTKPEMIVRSLVHSMGYRYRLHLKSLPGKPDLVFPGRRKIIFVHGCYWHMHSCRFGQVVPQTNRDFWQIKRQSNVSRDARNIAALKAEGWQVLLLWECMLDDTENLRKTINDFLLDPR
jgi:DNA mismatch endonuclease (patch repair protein)